MERIAILTSTGIGDIISLTALINKLKKEFPKSQIILFTVRGGFLKSQKIEHIDSVIKLDKIKWFKLVFSQFTIFINLGYFKSQTSLPKQILYRLINTIQCTRRKACLNNLDTEPYVKQNVVNIRLNILHKINILTTKSDYKIYLPFAMQKKALPFVGRYTVIHLGAKATYKTRLWHLENWIEVIRYLIRANYYIVLIGSEAEQSLNNKITKEVGSSKIIDMSHKLSISQTACIIKNSAFMISTNSGPMWIGAALEIPQIVLCGPSKFVWEPFNDNAIVVRVKIDRKYCRIPCDNTACYYNDNLCMKRITVKQVKNAINKIMETNK